MDTWTDPLLYKKVRGHQDGQIYKAADIAIPKTVGHELSTPTTSSINADFMKVIFPQL